MINEVDEALRNLVTSEISDGTDVEVLFDAPTREWASRRNSPTIDLYLYDIREDLARRSVGRIEQRDARGQVAERHSLPRFFKLAYLITAWTQRPEDEHRLLTAILANFIRLDVLPTEVLPPLLADLGMPIATQIAYPPPEDRQVSDVWSSLGGDLKPSIELLITLPIVPDRLHEIAKAVMKPLRLRSLSQVTYEAEDDIRHLPDPTELEAAESKGRKLDAPNRKGRTKGASGS